MKRLLWLPVIAALAACPGPIEEVDDGIIHVGPEGGTFITSVGVVLDVPKGALEVEAQITVTVVDSGIPEVPNRSRISLGYRLSPSSLVLKEPLTLRIPYLEDRLPAAGIDPATYDMRRGTGDDPYLQLPTPTTETQFKVVRARTEKLGLFWVTSPQKPAVSDITITPEEVYLQVGGTQQFTAQVTDPAGNPLPDVAVTWSIVPARVASVDPTGLVTALDPGTALLTATAAGATVQAPVYVIGTTAGPTTFIHENPFPTGNDLYGGGISGGFTFFVGGNGTLLMRSPDNAWTRLYSTPGVTLKAAAGALPSGGVAVGVSGTSGVLLELTDPSAAPTVKTFNSVEPRALWYDGTHGMAVGTGNDVIMRRNGQWQTEYSPSFETLLDVIGDGQGGFTTVGGRGSLYQYDPVTSTWDSLYDTQLNVLLGDAVITTSNGSEAWAVGANQLWRFVGTGWQAINLPSQPALSSLSAIGSVDGQIVVAGQGSGSAWLLLYEPTSGTWSSQELRGGQIIRDIFGDGTTAYAVGDVGVVWQYVSGTFVELSGGFYGDVADIHAGEGIVVAAVNEDGNGKVYARAANGAWQELGFQPFAGPLFSVVAKSPTEVYAGGIGVLWQWNGMSWSPQFLNPSPPLFDLALCGETLWAVGDAGLVFKGNGVLTQQPSLGQNPLRAVHCRSDAEVWISGDNALWRIRGSNRVFVKDPKVNHAPWRSVWSPGSGEAYAFGDARFGVYWNTAQMLVYDAPGGLLPEIVNGLWGSSVDNLYAVGYTVSPVKFGYAVRFNGAQWTLVDAGAERPITAIHGASATEVYLGTEGGGILRGVSP